VARYERVNLGLDAGIARLEPGIQAVNRALLSNRLILAPEMPQLQDILEKSGRTTHITRGQVRGVGTFGGFFPAMRLVLPAGSPGPISDAGDSGSTWYDAVTFAAKGLHVAIDLQLEPSRGDCDSRPRDHERDEADLGVTASDPPSNHRPPSPHLKKRGEKGLD